MEEEFARAFYHADVLVVLPIYAAGEDPIPGITAERLAGEIKRFGHRDVSYAPIVLTSLPAKRRLSFALDDR